MSRFFVAAAALGLSALPAAAGCVGPCYQQSYVPPAYETVTERVMTRAPRTYAITTPAQYGTVHETVQVSPGGRHWSVTVDAHGRKVGCWVTTKPRYSTVARTVMVQAPQVIPYAEPAQYGFRSHTVQTQAGYKTWTPVGSGYGGGYGSRGYGPSLAVGSGYEGGYGSRGGYRSRGSYGGGYEPSVGLGFGVGIGSRGGYGRSVESGSRYGYSGERRGYGGMRNAGLSSSAGYGSGPVGGGAYDGGDEF